MALLQRTSARSVSISGTTAGATRAVGGDGGDGVDGGVVGDGGEGGGLLTLKTDPTSPTDRSVSHTISLSASPDPNWSKSSKLDTLLVNKIFTFCFSLISCKKSDETTLLFQIRNCQKNMYFEHNLV